jgi:hypothetical protein
MKTFNLNEEGLAAFFATVGSYTLVEVKITTFSFVRLFKNRVKEVIIGNTYQLKQISLAWNNRTRSMPTSSARRSRPICPGYNKPVPVTLPPVKIQKLRSLFTTYRLYRKQETPLKNRIHSLLKKPLYSFTQEEI